MKLLFLLILIFIYYLFNIETNIPTMEVTSKISDNYDYHLNINENKIYEQVIDKIKNYETTILPNTIISTEQLNNIMNKVFYYHPEFFYIETSYSYKYSNNIILQINLHYNELLNNIENHKIIFDTKVNEILENAKLLETDLEKEKYIHDYLVEHVVYDENSKVNQSAYSSLIYNSSVCAGYARAFQYLMNQLEIPTYYCSGTSFVNHAWNIVYIDGRYFNVDVTWNDSNNTEMFYNKNDAYFSKTHTRSEVCKLLPRSE